MSIDNCGALISILMAILLTITQDYDLYDSITIHHTLSNHVESLFPIFIRNLYLSTLRSGSFL